MREFIGNTLKDALEKACQYYNLASEDDLNYKIVHDKKMKSSRIFDNFNSVVILAERREEMIDDYEETPENLCEPCELSDYLNSFIKKFSELSQLDLNVRLVNKKEDNSILVKINGKDSQALLNKENGFIQAFQTILYSILKNSGLTIEKKVYIDVSDYRLKREAYLKDLALTLRIRVLKTKKEKTIPNLNSFERRIIHTTLQEFGDVSTLSEGEGRYKTLKIYLKK